MSIWILIVVLAAALSVALVLDGAARWNQGSSLVLDHYERLLSDSRDRAAARENTELAETAEAQLLSGHATDPPESDSTPAEAPGPSHD